VAHTVSLYKIRWHIQYPYIQSGGTYIVLIYNQVTHTVS